MIPVLKVWYHRHFSDPQAVILALSLLIGFSVIVFMGNLLAPIIAAVVIAYVLEGLVSKIQKLGIARMWAVIWVFAIFIALFLFSLLGLVPLLFQQLSQFFKQLPNMITQGQQLLMALPERYTFISEDQVLELMAALRVELANAGQKVLSLSLSSAAGFFVLMVFMVVVPLLVFFFLKDKNQILAWILQFMPAEHGLVARVWADVDIKIGNYVRGKVLEIVIVGVAAYIPFAFMGLQFAALLSLLVGLSVIIPYIGAIAVTVPIALVAFFQWGLSSDFVYLMVIYGVIQFIDGNLLVPVLFSEVVNIHPVAIIIAVLVFGGLWGVWGVFFAIPLATLVQAVINAWPAHPKEAGAD